MDQDIHASKKVSTSHVELDAYSAEIGDVQDYIAYHPNRSTQYHNLFILYH